MSEIKCPHCGEVFSVDESGFSEIVKQVRNDEFAKELAERQANIEKLYEEKLKSNQALTKNQNDKELNELKNEILHLKGLISQNEKDRALAIHEALEKQQKIDQEKQQKIVELQTRIASEEKNHELSLKIAVEEATSKQKEELLEKEKQIIALKGDVDNVKKDLQLQTTQLRDNYEGKLKDKEETIAYYKDLKTRLSTKLVGETLEQHCQNQFNQLRMTAFPNAYFEKDNDAKTGSKGDYIYRESEDDTEFISIMFEMKNENDTTATKHKNEDFFKELDKDRNEKGCEYAVLVSMLEADSELYNGGIVDVSYRYPKMYVVRPQCFIPIITLLRNANRNSLNYQKQLVEVKNQNIDISHFEEDMEDFKTRFERQFTQAHDRFEDAIEKIEQTIKYLEKVKENLRKSDDHLSKANKIGQELTIKKLTKNNPTMREKFDELNKDK